MVAMRKITGSWELRYIMRCTDIDALQSVHAEIGRRIDMLKRLSQSKALRHGDRVQFERSGHTIAGTLYKLHTDEAWIKGDDGTIYMGRPSDLEKVSAFDRVPARGGLCHPDTAPATVGQGRR